MKYVYIYRGTFDPLHNNHEAIIRWCLTQCEPDSTAQVVIHINSRQLDEKSTKAPASWEIRADIIRRTLVDVDIAPKGSFTDTLNWIKNKYGADSKIIQVIGSDAFDKLEANSRKYSDSINSYLVAVRSSKNEIPITLCEKPVGQIPVEVQQSTISSTAIRQLLLMGNKYALKNYVSTVTESILLSSEEYTPLHLSARNLILQNLCVLSFAVLSEIKKYFGCDVYLRHSENQGLSGDHILFIKEKDGGIKAVCKVFQKQEEAQLESDGYTLFQKHHLKTPLLYFCFENCVCIEFVRGHKPSTIEEYRRVGQAFRTLHDRTKKETIQTELSNEISHASRKMAGLKFNNPLLEKNIQEIYAILLFKYTLAKRDRCVIHGDAQTANVLIDDQDEPVFIDLNGTQKSEDAFRDLYQTSSATFWCAINGYDNDILLTASDSKLLSAKIHALFDGYNHVMMTPEKLFWKFYWGMRTLSLAYKERINSVPEEVFDEIINQIKLFVCEIFTECLSPAILSMLRPSLNMNMLWVHPIKDLLEESRSMVNSQIPKLEVQMAH